MAGLEELMMLQQLEQRSNPLYALAQGVSQGIQEEQNRLKAKKLQEEELSNSLKTIERINNTNGSKIGRIIPSMSMKDGKISVGFDTEKPISAKEEEMLEIRRENAKIALDKEKRLRSKDRLLAAQKIGGILDESDLKNVQDEYGFDLGTNTESGRIEPVDIDGVQKFRILSDEEFGKKSDIIKSAKDAESGLNIISRDLEQISKMFDSVSPQLRGPIEGRIKAPIAKIQGNTGVVVYDDAIKAFTSNIARSLLLEKGVLTNEDVERAKRLLPKLEDTDEIKTQKMNEIKLLLKTRYDEFSRRISSGISDTTIKKSKFSNLW